MYMYYILLYIIIIYILYILLYISLLYIYYILLYIHIYIIYIYMYIYICFDLNCNDLQMSKTAAVPYRETRLRLPCDGKGT